MTKLQLLPRRRVARFVSVCFIGLLLAVCAAFALRGVSADAFSKFGFTEQTRLGELLARLTPGAASPAPAAAFLSSGLVISQVYGGSGNSGATYTHDFIELYNRGSVAINVTGWSVQYASATGTSWSVTNLPSVSIAPGKYFLIQEASNAAVGAPLPTPDATGAIAMSATAGKVALVNSTTALSGSGCPFDASVIDFVGYGTTADCREGSGTGNNAPAPSATTADIRRNFGCTETDVNSADFATGAPTPRNSASSSITVNDLGDATDASAGNGVCATSGGVCTLRAAIQEANGLAACHTVTINFSVTGTIQLSSALPSLTKSMSFNGPGADQLTVRRNTAAITASSLSAAAAV